MADSVYMGGRKRYQRPQGILWSNNAGTLSNGIYVPNGYEVGADTDETDPALLDQFIILSDHNRTEMSFNPIRIENRRRTINGRMRSYHIADKISFSVSWNLLPSRSYNTVPNFSTGEFTDGISPLSPKYSTRDAAGVNYTSGKEYTADGGAGGVEILDWYNNHKGSFWMFLAYDNYANFGKESSDYTHLSEYNEIVEVFFADFNYSVVKRGGSNHDLWNISVTLEEV
jgi:hypothetical protein